jgi:hypothetical protein
MQLLQDASYTRDRCRAVPNTWVSSMGPRSAAKRVGIRVVPLERSPACALSSCGGRYAGYGHTVCISGASRASRLHCKIFRQLAVFCGCREITVTQRADWILKSAHGGRLTSRRHDGFCGGEGVRRGPQLVLEMWAGQGDTRSHHYSYSRPGSRWMVDDV